MRWFVATVFIAHLASVAKGNEGSTTNVDACVDSAIGAIESASYEGIGRAVKQRQEDKRLQRSSDDPILNWSQQQGADDARMVWEQRLTEVDSLQEVWHIAIAKADTNHMRSALASLRGMASDLGLSTDCLIHHYEALFVPKGKETKKTNRRAAAFPPNTRPVDSTTPAEELPTFDSSGFDESLRAAEQGASEESTKRPNWIVLTIAIAACVGGALAWKLRRTNTKVAVHEEPASAIMDGRENEPQATAPENGVSLHMPDPEDMAGPSKQGSALPSPMALRSLRIAERGAVHYFAPEEVLCVVSRDSQSLWYTTRKEDAFIVSKARSEAARLLAAHGFYTIGRDLLIANDRIGSVLDRPDGTFIVLRGRKEPVEVNRATAKELSNQGKEQL